MTERIVHLRVDLDFRVCVDLGLPFLLREFRRRGVRATFFAVMGPDTMGAHRTRLRRPGYMKRLWSMNLCKMALMVGWTQLARLAGRTMVWSDPGALRDAVAQGHELGVHGFDHAWWAENCWSCSREELVVQVDLAVERFRRYFPDLPLVWGAPNWRCNLDAVDVVREHGAAYASDTRGAAPFYPCGVDGVRALPQLPISLPCLHELAQHGVPMTRLPETMLSLVGDGYNLLCIHGYYEGLLQRRTFLRFLDLAQEQGVRFAPLRDALSGADEPEARELGVVRVPGGFSEVSCRGDFVDENYFQQLHLQGRTG